MTLYLPDWWLAAMSVLLVAFGVSRWRLNYWAKRWTEARTAQMHLRFALWNKMFKGDLEGWLR